MPMLVAADSSAIVKLVLVEEGSQLARLVWEDADAVQATRLARVEAAAAVAAARRARRIRRTGELSMLPVFGFLRVAAYELTDAIHLAAALDTGATLLTWDRRLAAAATTEGLAVLPQG